MIDIYMPWPLNCPPFGEYLHFYNSFKNNKNVNLVNTFNADYIVYINDIKNINVKRYKNLNMKLVNQIKNFNDHNKEIILDYTDFTNTSFCSPEYKVLLYFKRSIVYKKKMALINLKNIIPLSYGIRNDYLPYLNDTYDRNIDVSYLFTGNERGMRCIVYDFLKKSKLNQKYKIKLGRVKSKKDAYSNINLGYLQQMQKSKIVVTCNPKYQEGDYRLWEAIASKALVLVDSMKTPIKNPLIDFKHIVYYNSPEELEKLIQYFLENENERLRIATDGFNYCIQNHTFNNRVNFIIDKIKSKKKINKNNLSFISNTCIGYLLFNKYNLKYNNPFIGSLFIDDLQYIKFCQNLEYYINIKPEFRDPEITNYYSDINSLWYAVKSCSVKIPYVVMYLDDIQIHWIHERDSNNVLKKYNYRLDRFKQKLKDINFKVICLMSYSEFLNSDDYKKKIIKFSKIKYNKIFIGPDKYKHLLDNYIPIKKWDNISMERNYYNGLKFNNQDYSRDLFYNYINNMDSKINFKGNMLVYSICYYYTKNNKNNILHHIKSFNKINEDNKVFIITCMIDSNEHKFAINEITNFINQYNIKFKVLTSFNWGGTILGLWLVYKYLFNNIHNQLFDKTYIAHFEEDFKPVKPNFYIGSKRRLDLFGKRYIYVGESKSGKINIGDHDKRLTGKAYINSKRLGNPEVWTDGGYYFSNVENLRKIENKIGIFHKGDSSKKYIRALDGIDLGEVGFPTLLHHNGFKFYALKRGDFFIHG